MRSITRKLAAALTAASLAAGLAVPTAAQADGLDAVAGSDARESYCDNAEERGTQAHRDCVYRPARLRGLDAVGYRGAGTGPAKIVVSWDAPEAAPPGYSVRGYRYKLQVVGEKAPEDWSDAPDSALGANRFTLPDAVNPAVDYNVRVLAFNDRGDGPRAKVTGVAINQPVNPTEPNSPERRQDCRGYYADDDDKFTGCRDWPVFTVPDADTIPPTVTPPPATTTADPVPETVRSGLTKRACEDAQDAAASVHGGARAKGGLVDELLAAAEAGTPGITAYGADYAPPGDKPGDNPSTCRLVIVTATVVDLNPQPAG